MKLNNEEQVESIDIRISKNKTPIAYENKVLCLMDSGLSREEAEKEVDGMVITCEIYYEIGQGLFAVEQEAVDGGASIYSPYTREEIEPCDED